MRTMTQIAWKRGLRVIIRIDGDVAMKGKRVSDDFRLRQAVPTITEVLHQGGRVRIISHRGRPHGSVTPPLSQRAIVRRLSQFLGRKIVFVADPFDKKIAERRGGSSDILFFENIRFWKGEEENSVSFARKLAEWGDIYINDAFANCHRSHASVEALASLLPSYAGMRLEQEVAALTCVVIRPEHPFTAILGGAKLETKLPLIERFVHIADDILIGGAIANTLLAAHGFPVGKSMIDHTHDGLAGILSNSKIHIPSDVVVAKSLRRASSSRSSAVEDVRSGDYIVDIGPKTIKAFSSVIERSRMIMWNGPLGYGEIPRFAAGTIRIAGRIRNLREFKLVGGGDSIALLRAHGALRGFSYVCTGGGAMLEFLAGKKLPGIEVLRKS